MKEGIWLGMIERQEEHTIGTDAGIVKCRTIKRRPAEEQWNGEQILAAKGATAQPVRRYNTDRIPAAVLDSTGKPVSNKPRPEPAHKYKPQQPATRLANEPRALKIFKKDVEKYGAIEGCQACTEAIMDRATASKALRYVVPHNAECRARMVELMKEDGVDKARVARVEGRNSRFQEEKVAAQTGGAGVTTAEGSKDSPRDSSAPLRLGDHAGEALGVERRVARAPQRHVLAADVELCAAKRIRPWRQNQRD